MTSLFYEMENNPFMFQTTNQPIPLSKTSKDSEVMWFSTFFNITGSHVFALNIPGHPIDGQNPFFFGRNRHFA